MKAGSLQTKPRRNTIQWNQASVCQLASFFCCGLWTLARCLFAVSHFLLLRLLLPAVDMVEPGHAWEVHFAAVVVAQVPMQSPHMNRAKRKPC